MKPVIFTILTTLALVFSGAAQNPRNVVLYNLTDTDCGPCSCMDSIIRHSVVPNYPQTIVIALHSPMPNSHFNKYQGKEIFFTFHADYEPSGFIDGLGYDTPYGKVADSIGKRYEESPEAPVEIKLNSKSWDPVTRKVTLDYTLKNLSEELQGACWYNIFVTESNIKQMHRTMTGCSTPDVQGLPFRNEYFNDHVIRKLEYFAQGDSLIGPVWPSQQSIQKQFEIAIDTAWVPENTNIALVVYKKNDSLYKSPVLQALNQNVVRPVGVEGPLPTPDKSKIITVYPNPGGSWINVHIAAIQAGRYVLEIVDMKGRPVATLLDQRCDPGIYNLEFNASEWTPGVYHCVYITPAGRFSEKLVIRR